MWRTAKRDVIEEINLPLQTEQVHWLEFSPVERHFYARYLKKELEHSGRETTEIPGRMRSEGKK